MENDCKITEMRLRRKIEHILEKAERRRKTRESNKHESSHKIHSC